MNIFQSYRTGWKQLFRLPGLFLFVYFIQLLFAFLIAFPLKGLLNRVIGHQTFLDKSAGEFDFIIFSDLLNNYGDLFTVWLNQSVASLLFFSFFYIFITGGILDILVHTQEGFNFKQFWGGAGKYFGKLLGTFFIFITIQLFLIVLFAGMFVVKGINPLELDSDRWVIDWIMWLLPVLILLQVILSMMHDHVKVAIVQNPDDPFLQVIRKRTGAVMRKFFPALGLYLLVLAPLALLYLAGMSIQDLLPGTSPWIEWAGLLISQLLILGRIGLRLVNFSSIHAFYQLAGEKQEG